MVYCTVSKSNHPTLFLSDTQRTHQTLVQLSTHEQYGSPGRCNKQWQHLNIWIQSQGDPYEELEASFDTFCKYTIVIFRVRLKKRSPTNYHTIDATIYIPPIHIQNVEDVFTFKRSLLAIYIFLTRTNTVVEESLTWHDTKNIIPSKPFNTIYLTRISQTISYTKINQ